MIAPFRVVAWLVCLVLLAGTGCMEHTMETMPGAMNFRLIVDNGVGDVVGRVTFIDLGKDAKGPRTASPVPDAAIGALDGQGKPLAEVGTTRTDSRGLFRLHGFAIGQPAFVRARLTDREGHARTLSAFVLPESKLTCVELSLASTIVAQKILRGEIPLANLDPRKVDDLVREVARTILEVLPPWPDNDGPPVDPPADHDLKPSPGPAPATWPQDNYWNPPEGGGGYAWVSGPGGGQWRYRGPSGDSWWVPVPDCGCGGYWWRPAPDGGPGGSWWMPSPGGGSWWTPGVGAPGPDGRIGVAIPGCGCHAWWAPGPGPCGCHWIPSGPEQTGRWYSPGGNGAWWTPGAGWADAPAYDGHYWVPPAGDGGGFWNPPSGTVGPCEWLPWPDGTGGYWSCPLPGGRRCFWIPRPEGGGFWWSPAEEGTSGASPGGWWIPPHDGRPGCWWTPPCGAPDAQGRTWVPFPGGSGGCWWRRSPGYCSCVWVPCPGREGGWWWMAGGDRGQWWNGSAWAAPRASAGDVWGYPPVAPGGYWQQPDGVNGRRVWLSMPGGGGCWCLMPYDGSSPCFWVALPGGGGYWCRRSPSGGTMWWVPNPRGTGGTWWAPPSRPDGQWWPSGWQAGGAIGAMPAAPGGGDCPCVWVPAPACGCGGYWFMPAPGGADGGMWWVSGPGGVGGSWWPAPAPTAQPPAGSGGGYRWMAMPGGGGTWWAPAPDSPGGYWWLPGAGGGVWFKAVAGHCFCHWVPLPGGGGAWWAGSPSDPDGLWWWPDEGVWRAAAPTSPSGGAPSGPPGVAPIAQDLWTALDGLLSGDPSGGAPVFDMLAAGAPALQTQLNQATDTYLIGNVIVQFQGVNNAPFPRRDDPRYLLTGDVQLGCQLDGASVPSLAFAMNGELICEAAGAGGAWKATWNTRTRPDGDYFLTAHEVGPNHTLGRMIAKGYAHIHNTPDRDAPCNEDWAGGI